MAGSFENKILRWAKRRQYHMVRSLGRGSFAEVWEARTTLGLPVAVKILAFPQGHAKSRREEAALSLIRPLRHPFLLQLRDFYWSRDRRLYIVTELADRTVLDRLDTGFLGNLRRCAG
jgi:serine/threonine protein kinase